ncbi:hypothetical protein BpHYR1_045954 [Brachionus plicatilis]|uniref:Uncharacterized protein n=1 Tax=Brachionus plicatilis TaxID=10195 RepID=A0A3M7T6V0_BRAPC|nr:hypothetical protein BpHYR1_045954 [Brachionus plicatilis]
MFSKNVHELRKSLGLQARLELHVALHSCLHISAHGSGRHVNHCLIAAREQVSQPTKQAGLVLLSHFDVYVVQIDDRRNYVDACLFVAQVLVVLVGQFPNRRNQVVHKAGLAISLYLFEFVEQKGIKVLGCFQLNSLVLRLQRVDVLVVVYVGESVFCARFLRDALTKKILFVTITTTSARRAGEKK